MIDSIVENGNDDGLGCCTAMNCSISDERRARKLLSRPALQIYRPPGLRNSDEVTNTKPNAAAGAKQFRQDITEYIKRTDVNENSKWVEAKELHLSRGVDSNTLPYKCTISAVRENDSSVGRARTESVFSNDSTTSSQTSDRSMNARKPSVDPAKSKQSIHRPASTSSTSISRGSSNRIVHSVSDVGSKKDIKYVTQKDSSQKKKTLGAKEIEVMVSNLRKLDFGQENSVIEQFIASNFSLGKGIGQMLVRLSIEEDRQSSKAVAKIAGQLLCTNAAQVVYQGTIAALNHYFDCRDRLRSDHFRVWIGFLHLVTDLFAHMGFINDGELVDLVFKIFDFMLKPPVLVVLKIEELESLISCLLSAGYDLERQCPERLVSLKNLIRNAFVEVQEPWARKMILLLLELGASGWKLPPAASEYYFQHTSS